MDFASADEYNDYLEQKEDIIFNLTERIDVEATAARLAKYERDNADSILAVNLRQASCPSLKAYLNSSQTIHSRSSVPIRP